MKIGYMRVSTNKQETEMQLSALRDKGCDEVFQDKGISGKQMKRPGLDAALKKLQSGDQLIVWKLDRFGRSSGDVITMIDDLTNRGVGFISLTEKFDTTTPMGNAMVGMLAVFARFEREMIVHRVRAGIAEYRKENKNWGRTKHAAKNHTAEILSLADAGRKQDEIASQLGFSQAAISRILSKHKNPPFPRNDSPL